MICSACDSTTTYRRPNTGYQQWRFHNGSRLCRKCYDKYVRDPIYNPIKNEKYGPINSKKWNPINNPKKIRFMNKRIMLKENPRKGICLECGKTDCITDIHHIKYHPEDPLKDTVELCKSCHGKITTDRPIIKNQYGVFKRKKK
jgi:hypothetical protein